MYTFFALIALSCTFFKVSNGTGIVKMVEEDNHLEKLTGENFSFVNKYNVTLNPNGGTFVEGKNLTEYIAGANTLLPTSADIHKKYYTFNGWFDNVNLSGTKAMSISNMATGDLTFWAKWTENDKYTVSFDMNGHGEVISSQIVYDSYSVIAPTNPTAKGYNFLGWYSDASLTTLYDFDESVYSELTLYAKWIKITVPIVYPHPTYHITYDTNEGTINDEEIVTKYKTGDEVILPIDVSKDGYLFTGWYLDERLDRQGPIKELSYLAMGDLAFYASYIKNDLKENEAYINLHINNYLELDIKKICGLNEVINFDFDLRQKNYKLVGYKDNALLKGDYITSLKVTRKVCFLTIYPVWQKAYFMALR
jgi:Listeria/Bacterioides repeat